MPISKAESSIKKNRTTYQNTNGSIVSVDRWIIEHHTKLTVNDGYVSFEKGAEQGTAMTQNTEISNFVGNTYTLAVKLKDEGLRVAAGTFVTGNEVFKTHDTDDGEDDIDIWVSKNATTNKLSVFIMTSNSSPINIEYIKLEKGSVYTGMPVWNETIELLKCQRYFQTYWRFPLFLENENYLSGFIPLNFSPSMVKTPTLEFKELLGTNAVPASAKIIKTAVDKTNIINVEFDKAFGYKTGYVSFNADAETH